jgi:glycosyltransferase involved in cell wall biosynthesis
MSLKHWLNTNKIINEIENSKIFDESYYLNQIPLFERGNYSLIKHYVNFGEIQGLAPCIFFDPSWYKSIYPDIAKAKVNAFYHYITVGYKEKRRPHPLFDPQFYDVTKVNPIYHYFNFGTSAGKSPYRLFNPEYYEAKKKELNLSNLPIKSNFYTTFTEYLEAGDKYLLSPHPLFHTAYYRGQVPEIDKNPINSLVHFEVFGYKEGVNPHPLFNSHFYHKLRPDVTSNILIHYLDFGENDGTPCSPMFLKKYYVSLLEKDSNLLSYLGGEWKKGLSGSPFINFAYFLQNNKEVSLNDDILINFYSFVVLASPNSYIAPELYFAIKQMEKGDYSTVFELTTENNNIVITDQVDGCTFYAPFEANSGLGEASRRYLETINKFDRTICSAVVVPTNSDKSTNKIKLGLGRRDWRVGLAQINADIQYSFFNLPQGKDFLKHEIRIGLWVWELPNFPIKWWINLTTYNEIWVPSNYCADSLLGVSNTVVSTIPYPIPAPEGLVDENTAKLNLREKLKISSNAFLYLFIFDTTSFIDRKNPLGAVRAFVKEFNNDPDTYLILKITASQQNPKFMRKLLKIIRLIKNKNIIILTENYSRKGILELILGCDCYLSPHRAEGFGLTVAEALFLEKPVVATNFSGTTDFLNIQTGYPVDYELIPMSINIEPYTNEFLWADPDISSFSRNMCSIRNNYTLAKAKASLGKAKVKELCSPERISLLISERIKSYNNL